ncbi:MAG: hypothetical protein HYR97_02420 [Candidatus Melainabacteria bacterium]|nr:hypothetical protein [Candidatus Melainabacteria bacterium]MBI3309673.1 hypothetical protein [Candidatus Melainabacteria bacterium]
MAETPYCPLLSIGKDVPVKCLEELCMFYVKQLKLCSFTVIGYTNALGIQTGSLQVQKPASTAQKAQEKPQTGEKKPETGTGGNPFALDDLE